MKYIILTFVLTIPFIVFADPKSYKEIKNKVDKLENAIIQDFDLKKTPKVKDKYSLMKHTEAIKEVEAQYGIQKNLLSKIEMAFFNLSKEIILKNQAGNLTNSELDKLKNSIEYANRIILTSRKKELDQIYNDLISNLDYTPSLKELFQKLDHSDYNNCEISNLSLNSDRNEITFVINHKTKEGEISSSHFNITEDDINKGQLSSTIRPLSNSNGLHEVITQFSDPKNGLNQFSLNQNKFGKIKSAYFHQEKIKKPLVSFLGFKLGGGLESTTFRCQSRDLASSYQK